MHWLRFFPLGVASPGNHGYLRGLGASEVFDYHAGDWVQQVRAAVPGGVDVLFDAAGGQTRDQAVGAVREGGRAIFLVGAPAQLGRGVVGESLDADVTRQRLEAIGRLVEAGRLRPQVEAVLPFDQVREALERVRAGTRAARSCFRLDRSRRPIARDRKCGSSRADGIGP